MTIALFSNAKNLTITLIVMVNVLLLLLESHTSNWLVWQLLKIVPMLVVASVSSLFIPKLAKNVGFTHQVVKKSNQLLIGNCLKKSNSTTMSAIQELAMALEILKFYATRLGHFVLNNALERLNAQPLVLMIRKIPVCYGVTRIVTRNAIHCLISQLTSKCHMKNFRVISNQIHLRIVNTGIPTLIFQMISNLDLFHLTMVMGSMDPNETQPSVSTVKVATCWLFLATVVTALEGPKSLAPVLTRALLIALHFPITCSVHQSVSLT